MKRRQFIKNTLLTTIAMAPACRSQIKKIDNNKTKVVLIGIDGANWPTIDPLIESGKLPFFKKLKAESAWAYLNTFKPTKSSVIWTSIATGKKMEKHGILDFTFLNQNNIEAPFTNSERREPAIWQILDSFGKRSIICNWFVSHPPDKINGIVVSDNYRRVVARPPEKLNNYKDSVYPPNVFYRLNKNIQRDYKEAFNRIGIPDFSEIYSKLHPNKNFRDVPILKTFRSMAKQDYFVTNYSKELYHTQNFDFFATYIRMPDLVQHFSARLFEKKYKAELIKKLKSNSLSKDEHKEVLGKISDILEPVYKFTENFVKDLMTLKKYKDAYFIIVSDHGFSLYPGGYNHYGLSDEYDAPKGIMMINGPEVKAGKIDSAHVFDITPTILNIFDKPIGKDMDGRALTDIFKFKRKRRYKLYKLKNRNKLKSTEAVDKDTMDELKSIGYI